MKLIPLFVLLALTSLHADPLVIYPSSDNRVLDIENNGRGNESRAEDHTSDGLNVGDNANNSVWRSVIKFDLNPMRSQLAAEPGLLLRLTTRRRLLQVPREWAFQVVQFPTDIADRILIGPVAGEDDFSEEGRIIHQQPAGGVRDGEQVEIDITAQVKEALAGNGILAFRLQLDPPTNNDFTNDQISFFSGSHDVNMPALRPQIISSQGR